MLETIVCESVFSYCKPTISALRCFGGAPFSCRKVRGGFAFKKSKTYITYSYVVAVVLVAISLLGFWCDLTACGQDYSRVRSNMDHYINTFDLGVVALNVLCGILMSPIKVQELFGILQCLTKIDTILNEPWTVLDKDRKFSKIAFAISYSFSLLGIAFETDYKFSTSEGDSRLKFLRNYGTLFLFYTLTLTQQTAYWNIIRFVKGRMRSMNRKIKLELVKFGGETCVVEVFKENFANGVCEKIENNSFHRTGCFITQRFRDLMTVHEQIYLCVNFINKFFDYPILLILINSIIEIIINPWFLITRQLTEGMDRWMLIVWILLRIIQLFLLIEPIHGVLVEHRKTNLFIVQLLKQSKDGPLRREVELFSTQYQMWKIHFSSVDMIYLHRTIYAAVTSAVTTYLVILIQLNK